MFGKDLYGNFGCKRLLAFFLDEVDGQCDQILSLRYLEKVKKSFEQKVGEVFVQGKMFL